MIAASSPLAGALTRDSLAHLLHQLQQLRAAVVGERLAEHGGQPADVGAQGVVAVLGQGESGTVKAGLRTGKAVRVGGNDGSSSSSHG